MAGQVLSEPDALYLYTLFALKDRNLGVVESNFVSAVELFFRSLRRDFPRLIADVANGTISADLQIDAAVCLSLA